MLAPVDWKFVLKMSISAFWSTAQLSPFAKNLSLQNVALGASSFTMLFWTMLATFIFVNFGITNC